MDTGDLCLRDREEAEGVVVAQVRLGGEGKLGEIGERLQVFGLDALGVECAAVMRHVFVGMAQRPFETMKLQFADDFDG